MTHGNERQWMGCGQLALARGGLALCAALSVLAVAVPDARADAEADFSKHPTAAAAEAIAQAALGRNQLAKAMNWLERIPQCPGAKLDQLTRAAKLRSDLRYRLADAGIAPVSIRVDPPSAIVVIDGAAVPFHSGQHYLWLPEGVHHMDVIAPQYATATQSISARRGERESVEVTLETTRAPTLIVQATPAAEVVIDGSPQGPSTRGKFVTTAGNHSIQLRAAGFEVWVKDMSFVAGDAKTIEAKLKPLPLAAVDPLLARRAHQIDRELTPGETAESAERFNFRVDVAGSPVEKGLGAKAAADAASSDSQKSARLKASGEAPKERPASAGAEPAAAGAADPGAAAARPERAAATEGWGEAPGSESGPVRAARAADAPRSPGDSEVRESEEVSTPMQRTTKGWIFGSVGLAAAGAGVALAWLGSQEAEAANQLTRGDDTYPAAYAAAAQKTYVGYGAAGLGAVGVGVGTYYLLGPGGLSRTGKGWFIAAIGTVTAAAGGWLAWDATVQANDTDTTLEPRDPEYTRRFDLAERNRLIGFGVAGAGAAIVATGVVVMATGPSSSAALAPSGTRTVAAAPPPWQVLPWLGAGRPGASLALVW